MPSPVDGTSIVCSFSRAGLKHELYIYSGGRDGNLALFERLESQRAELEAAYGRPLEFDEMAGKIACRIAEYREGTVEAEADHDGYVDWLIGAGDDLRRALEAV